MSSPEELACAMYCAAVRRGMVAQFRALAGELPAQEWKNLARAVGRDILKLTDHKASESGHYRIKFEEDDEPTKPEHVKP